MGPATASPGATSAAQDIHGTMAQLWRSSLQPQLPATDFPPLPPAAPPDQRARRKPKPQAASTPVTAAPLERRLDALLDQVAILTRQNADLMLQMRQLREENAKLHRELAATRPLQVHNPYVPAPGLFPMLATTSTPPRERAPEPTEDVIMTPPKAVHSSDPGEPSPDAKRARASVALGDDVL